MKNNSTLFIALDTYSRIGGLQAFNRRIIANLASRAMERGGEQPTIYCMGDGPDDFPVDLAARFKGFGRNRIALIRAILAKSASTDVLLVGHINLLPVAWIAKRVLPKLRVVLFVHGDEVWNDAQRPRKWFEPYLLRSVDRIASVSQFTADVMSREYGVPGKCFTIFPNAVDPLPESAQIERLPNTILSVTRMAEGDRLKNLDVLIRSVAILAQTGRNVRLDIVGSGALRQELEALVMECRVTEHVSFLGNLSDVELDRAYRSASLFALPSSKEGFGIVFLEAWQRGLPVVCGSLGASHEIVSDGIDGFVVDELDVQQVAMKIGFLLDHPDEAAAMGLRGRQKVEELYLAPHSKFHLNKLLNLYD